MLIVVLLTKHSASALEINFNWRLVGNCLATDRLVVEHPKVIPTDEYIERRGHTRNHLLQAIPFGTLSRLISPNYHILNRIHLRQQSPQPASNLRQPLPNTPKSLVSGRLQEVTSQV